MNKKSDASGDEDAGESVGEIFVHLEKAKERYQTASRQPVRNKSYTGLQRKIRRRSDGAVLASNPFVFS